MVLVQELTSTDNGFAAGLNPKSTKPQIERPPAATSHSAKPATATASANPTGPATWLAPPVKVDTLGVMPVAVGLEPFALMLLTIKDGQGVPAETYGSLRVTVTSGAGPDGQAVPQAARTVD